MPQTIHLATDHAGFDHKESIKTYLEDKGYDVVDHGATTLSPEDDYPVYIQKAVVEVSNTQEDIEENPETVAIILGGSGQGEAIVAGRFPYVRTTVCYGGPHAEEIVTLGREHNNANVLSLGARFIQIADALEVVDVWLTTSFSKEPRHMRRVKQIEDISKK